MYSRITKPAVVKWNHLQAEMEHVQISQVYLIEHVTYFHFHLKVIKHIILLNVLQNRSILAYTVIFLWSCTQRSNIFNIPWWWKMWVLWCHMWDASNPCTWMHHFDGKVFSNFWCTYPNACKFVIVEWFFYQCLQNYFNDAVMTSLWTLWTLWRHNDGRYDVIVKGSARIFGSKILPAVRITNSSYQ